MRLFKKKPVEPIRTCPFCNGTPRLTKCGDQKEFLVYQCSRCYETPVRFHEARLTECEARKVWNRRAEEAEYILNLDRRVAHNLGHDCRQVSDTAKLTYELLELATELDAREVSNNSIISDLHGTSWVRLCERGIKILELLK